MKKLFILTAFIISAVLCVQAYNNKLSINTQNLIRDINNSNNSLLKSSSEKHTKIGAYIIVENGADL